ncbi:MAG: ion transporter [Gammaproteobacteria bacterium]|nr:ion transporter [Gammaproteobacteria bacterium]
MVRERLRELYEGRTAAATRLRWWLLALDIALVAFFLATTFVEHGRWLLVADAVIGAFLLAEWMARLWTARDRAAYLIQPLTAIDLAVILSLFAPSVSGDFIFLRVLRALRLLRSYRVLNDLRSRSRWFRSHEPVVFAATNLAVFVFVVSAAVYALQVHVNDKIRNYVDALYFTVTTLTTTGFGDIIMVGSASRLLAVVIMIVGVSLFVRLIQAVFVASKTSYECPDCGLTRHDPDAIHCKHCGRLLHIPTEGEGV